MLALMQSLDTMQIVKICAFLSVFVIVILLSRKNNNESKPTTVKQPSIFRRIITSRYLVSAIIAISILGLKYLDSLEDAYVLPAILLASFLALFAYRTTLVKQQS